MNVLVTGGAGCIGSHTCVELIKAGHTPIVIDNLSNSNPESLHRVAEITGKTVEFIEGDVRDEALLEKIFAEHEISCAIHFAGLKAVGESVAKPMEYYQNNLDASSFPRPRRSTPATMRCRCARPPRPETAPIPMAGQNTWGSRSCVTSQKWTPTGRS